MTCWRRPGNWSRSRMRPHLTTARAGQDPARQPGELPAPAVTGGMSLTLPYVPARLVIEVSGPAEAAGLAERRRRRGSARAARAGPGRLAAGGRK